MLIAKVVICKRIPAERPWFDYLIPDDVKVGQQVAVKMRGRMEQGVVWEIMPLEKRSFKIQNIVGVISEYPVISKWQIEFMSLFSQAYEVSLGTLLTTTLPKGKIKSGNIKINGAEKEAKGKQPRVYGYNNRREITEYLTKWLNSESRTKIVLVPTIEDAQALARENPRALLIHGKLTPKKYREAYEKILSGECRKIVGTVKSLSMPYGETPIIMVDQEEHWQYKQNERTPHFSAVRALDRLKICYQTTTPAPSVRSYLNDRSMFRATRIKRILATLGKNPDQPWLAPETEQLISGQGGTAVWILAQRNYATAMICRDCGLAIECPHCRHRVSFKHSLSKQIKCLVCNQESNWPERCAKCRGQAWKMIGLGSARWPEIIAPYERVFPQAVIDTYRAYRRIPTLRKPITVIIVCGDQMLEQKDFSAGERAWQYLHRLETYMSESDRLIIQTFNPENDFWQHWLADRKKEWYEEEISIRQRMKLPPIYDAWIISHPKVTADELENVVNIILRESKGMVRGTLIGNVKINGGNNFGIKAIIQSQGAKDIDQYIDQKKVLPYPWEIDKDVDSWIG